MATDTAWSPKDRYFIKFDCYKSLYPNSKCSFEGGCQGMSRCLQNSDGSMRGHSREDIPAECLSRNVIVCKLEYVHRGLYLSRNEKKAVFSFCSSPAIYNGWVTWRKDLNKKKGSYPLLSMKEDQANKMNVERVYRWWPLAWEPGPDGSSTDPRLV